MGQTDSLFYKRGQQNKAKRRYHGREAGKDRSRWLDSKPKLNLEIKEGHTKP
jgi:hypothetical protein